MNIAKFTHNMAFGKLMVTVDADSDDKLINLLEKIKVDGFFSSADNNVGLNLNCDDRFIGAIVEKEKAPRAVIKYSITSPYEANIASLLKKLGAKVKDEAVETLLIALSKIKSYSPPGDANIGSLESLEPFGVQPDQVGLIVTKTGDLEFGPNFDDLLRQYDL